MHEELENLETTLKQSKEDYNKLKYKFDLLIGILKRQNRRIKGLEITIDFNKTMRNGK